MLTYYFSFHSMAKRSRYFKPEDDHFIVLKKFTLSFKINFWHIYPTLLSTKYAHLSAVRTDGFHDFPLSPFHPKSHYIIWLYFFSFENLNSLQLCEWMIKKSWKLTSSLYTKQSSKLPLARSYVDLQIILYLRPFFQTNFRTPRFFVNCRTKIDPLSS